jgi:Xaa-Pro dipeptidase
MTASVSQQSTQPALSIYTLRQGQLYKAMQTAGLPALVLNPGPSLVYLTGLHFHLSERPVVAIFVPDHPVTLIVPELELAKTHALSFPVEVFTFSDDPASWPTAYHLAYQSLNLWQQKIGVEPIWLRVLELRLLEESAPQLQFVLAGGVLAGLRMKKGQFEIMAMRNAVKIAQQALLNTIPLIRIGMSERELAAELTLQTLRAGSDPQLPFYPITCAGPNSANPHASPSERTLTPGDLLVIDWSAGYDGYAADLTRTFSIGEPDPECALIARIVKEANAAGRSVVRPGIAAGEVDHAARTVIEQAGYGQYFIHRTGHGLGMEVHEEPYMRAGNDLILEEGMTFTVEPGIYLPDRNGVRIEDNMVVTGQGGESLSDLPRELSVVGD